MRVSGCRADRPNAGNEGCKGTREMYAEFLAPDLGTDNKTW